MFIYYTYCWHFANGFHENPHIRLEHKLHHNSLNSIVPLEKKKQRVYIKSTHQYFTTFCVIRRYILIAQDISTGMWISLLKFKVTAEESTLQLIQSIKQFSFSIACVFSLRVFFFPLKFDEHVCLNVSLTILMGFRT